MGGFGAGILEKKKFVGWVKGFALGYFFVELVELFA